MSVKAQGRAHMRAGLHVISVRWALTHTRRKSKEITFRSSFWSWEKPPGRVFHGEKINGVCSFWSIMWLSRSFNWRFQFTTVCRSISHAFSRRSYALLVPSSLRPFTAAETTLTHSLYSSFSLSLSLSVNIHSLRVVERLGVWSLYIYLFQFIHTQALLLERW